MLIVATDLVNAPSDVRQLKTMFDRSPSYPTCWARLKRCWPMRATSVRATPSTGRPMPSPRSLLAGGISITHRGLTALSRPVHHCLKPVPWSAWLTDSRPRRGEPSFVRALKTDRRTCVRHHQAGDAVPAVPAQRPEQGLRRVEAGGNVQPAAYGEARPRGPRFLLSFLSPRPPKTRSIPSKNLSPTGC